MQQFSVKGQLKLFLPDATQAGATICEIVLDDATNCTKFHHIGKVGHNSQAYRVYVKSYVPMFLCGFCRIRLSKVAPTWSFDT
jgi:hypothetical protein